MQFTTEIMKLMNYLMKSFLWLEETKATATAILTLMSKICQFAINNRLGHSDQLTITIEII